MTKKEVRLYCKKQRAAIPEQHLLRLQDLLLIQFQHLQLPFLHFIHSYLPLENHNEVEPEPLLDSLLFSNPGLQIAVPKIISDTAMQHILINDSTIFQQNPFGIPEPMDGETIAPELFDLALVPLIGFDEKGNRVGFGKGYYDRFLAQCRTDCIIVGLSFLEAVDPIEDIDEWDIPLDYCVTPNKCYAF
jgi:5-formyltetrahydrofolate cyclo-ligase